MASEIERGRRNTYSTIPPGRFETYLNISYHTNHRDSKNVKRE